MSSKNFNTELDYLERNVAQYFSKLLNEKEEITIFDETDLEHDTPDDYLEVRNDITGNVFDVHPLKVTKEGILVVEVDDCYERYFIRLQDLSNIHDRINLVELMENSL